MDKCSFCEKQIPRGTGKMYVKTDGKIFYFCSSKCEKNMLVHKRKARNLKWTKTAFNLKKKEGKKK